MPTDEPKHEPINVRMADGSVYTLDGEHRLRAFQTKYGEADLETVLDAFRESVTRHWDDRTKPWKGITVGWGEDPYARPDESFANHAELAEPVLYSSIRAPLMAIMMAEMADDGEGAPSVIGIGEDRVVEYTGDAVVEHESLEPDEDA